MSKNKKNDENKGIYGFANRKEFVTWLIGVIIFVAISIGCILWGIKIEYVAVQVVGWIFLLSIAGILVGPIASELGAIIIGIMLLLMGFVLPFATGYYIIIPVTFIFGIAGILIIIDNVAELTDTKDRKYYKVIFDSVEQFSKGFYGTVTGEKRKKNVFMHIISVICKIIFIIWQLIIKGIVFFYVVIFAGAGIFLIYHKLYIWGNVLLVFAFFIASIIMRKKR